MHGQAGQPGYMEQFYHQGFIDAVPYFTSVSYGEIPSNEVIWYILLLCLSNAVTVNDQTVCFSWPKQI